MKVTICKDEKTAVDDNGVVYKINGVLVRKEDPKPDAFYDMETSFAKVVCSYNTPHNAIELTEGVINIL